MGQFSILIQSPEGFTDFFNCNTASIECFNFSGLAQLDALALYRLSARHLPVPGLGFFQILLPRLNICVQRDWTKLFAITLDDGVKLPALSTAVETFADFQERQRHAILVLSRPKLFLRVTKMGDTDL